jgi:hypothetical protein
MIAIIPATRAQIQSSQECNGAIYDREFLMVAGSQTMAIVKAEREPLIGCPVEIPFLKPFAVDSIDGIEIPGKNIDLQVFVFFA